MNACTEWNMGMRLIHMQVYTCMNKMYTCIYITIDIYSHVYTCMYMKKEGRKKQARSYKQQLQHNTPKAVTFQRK